MAERPIHARVPEQHRADGETGKNRQLAAGLREQHVAACHRNRHTGHESRTICNSHVGPHAHPLAKSAPDQVIQRCGDRSDECEQIAKERPPTTVSGRVTR